MKIFPIIVFCIGCFLWGSCSLPETKEKVCFKNRCIDVEIASRKEDLIKGLQFRTSLDKNSGMLFVFPGPDVVRFWMKDTKIPLDMIWMDEDKKVIFIETDVPPCPGDSCPTYGPLAPSRYVLEINAGCARRLGISVGGQAEFRF
ncbi:MAG TPA: DUF192 domain-containing protein [Candidatus Omnitrophota bacterium]|nr:DUF192 domain-containing protein [Candidatus Omnitrophota bacterium]HPD84807.1 DUF192 domain-containing protein [Candidatus Omnitrophota bacterium]HRZ03665.1 DUF192 domain-containing protein [Candidatus Omnitrophota bacterium]